MKIGALELLVIFVVILLVIGPDKLPQYARKFGNAMREFRKASADVTQEIKESVIDPLEEAQKPLREAMEPLDELDRSLKADVKSVEDEWKSIGKKPPKTTDAPAQQGPSAAAEENPSSPASAPEKENVENGGDTP